MQIRVKTKNPQWAFRKTYAKHMVIPEFTFYEGELKKKPHWAPSGEFHLMTGNPECPVHIINISDVVESWSKQ